MFKIVENIPKDNERVSLEEYYKFFTELYGRNILGLKPDFRYTIEDEKLRRKEIKNEFFARALGVVRNDAKIMNFVLYQEQEETKAIARFRTVEDELIISDIIYLTYPTVEEKSDMISKILYFLEMYGRELNIYNFYYEVPKTDEIAINATLENGWHFLEEPEVKNAKNDSYRTYLLEKNIRRREKNEPTRSRRQTKGSN